MPTPGDENTDRHDAANEAPANRGAARRAAAIPAADFDPDEGRPYKDDDHGHQDPAEARAAEEQTRVDNARKQFEVEQQARATNFERDQKALATKRARDFDNREATLKANAELAKASRENDEKAFEDGILTHEDLRRRSELLAPHHDYVLPWQVLSPDEATVKMAFPRTVILTRSASDLYGALWKDDEEHGDTKPAREDGRDFPLGWIANRSAITPITPGTRVLFQKGYQDVPVSLADHPYLFANGAYRLDASGKPETVADRERRLLATRVQQEKRSPNREGPAPKTSPEAAADV